MLVCHYVIITQENRRIYCRECQRQHRSSYYPIHNLNYLYCNAFRKQYKRITTPTSLWYNEQPRRFRNISLSKKIMSLKQIYYLQTHISTITPLLITDLHCNHIRPEIHASVKILSKVKRTLSKENS